LIDWKRFRRLFPHLAEEMEKGASKIPIDHFRVRLDHEDRLTARKWAGYNPDIVDFIRRCDTEDQAKEIIDYMERQGEITTEKAAELRKQLKAEGLKSFGDKKGVDFYNKER
jgi:hypothetical protein